ncbi:enoyl-CoA hydratase/isomerase family protein [Phytohabitans suffuscus]|uniref:enoyl-CoA hydratase/isomerase family protein n=1 Tax=Phytohabitans suffuscus TaxID=624315 RepID=UPI002F964890
MVGSSRAFEILLTARPILAAEAVRIGLALEPEPGTSAVEAAVGIARRIAEHDAFAVKLSREVLWANLDAPFDVAIEVENRTQILAALSEAPGRARQAFLSRKQ